MQDRLRLPWQQANVVRRVRFKSLPRITTPIQREQPRNAQVSEHKMREGNCAANPAGRRFKPQTKMAAPPPAPGWLLTRGRQVNFLPCGFTTCRKCTFHQWKAKEVWTAHSILLWTPLESPTVTGLLICGLLGWLNFTDWNPLLLKNNESDIEARSIGGGQALHLRGGREKERKTCCHEAVTENWQRWSQQKAFVIQWQCWGDKQTSIVEICWADINLVVWINPAGRTGDDLMEFFFFVVLHNLDH